MTDYIETIRDRFRQSIAVKQQLLDNRELLAKIRDTALRICKTIADGNRVLICGNGGSAADAQHIAAELSGKFYLERPALPVEACHVNTSFVTAVSNDYSFSKVYSRYIEGFGRNGDMLIVISTSGNSSNLIQAIETARSKKMFIAGMTGNSGGLMKDKCDILINVPSTDTPRIQEAHITVGHILCEIVENKLFG